MQQGGGSKDTWVLSEGPVSPSACCRPSARPVELSRGGGDLPSRAADNLYWLGRYVERAEGCVRLLRGILVRLTEKSGLAEAPELPALLRALTHQSDDLPRLRRRRAPRPAWRRPRPSCCRSSSTRPGPAACTAR